MSQPTERARILRWLNRRGGTEWGTDASHFDPDYIGKVEHRLRFVYGRRAYFRTDVRGLDRVPDAPVLLVGNHSGGTSIPDIWGFALAWYRCFGTGRVLHVLGHEWVFAFDGVGRAFAKMGGLRADKRLSHDALTELKHDVMVFPGGDQDTWRPFHQRYQVHFAGRKGYAQLAIRAGVPIVPVAHAGAQGTFIVLARGRRLAQWMGLPKLARATVWPIHISLPWGLAVGPLPHIPIPRTFRYRVGEPIHPQAAPSAEGDESGHRTG